MPTEFAALVASDWADQKHVWALQKAGSSERETGTIDHTPEAIEVWATQLRLRFGGPTHRSGAGTVPGAARVYVIEIRAPNHLSGSPYDAGELPKKLSPFRRQG